MFVQRLRGIKKMHINNKWWLKKLSGRQKKHVEEMIKDCRHDFEVSSELDQLMSEPVMSSSDEEQIPDMLFDYHELQPPVR